MMTRLFGNTVTNNVKFGTSEQNGVGKFNDITDKALQELKKLGITHVWYTGVIEHAVMADYTKFGIAMDDADVVKGRAGSPYAIKDYYDVNPDLAVNVKNRLAEFKALIERTHKNGLKVIIDFVPNHVARFYQSDAKPKGVDDFGAKDDKTKKFDPNNNFYYIVDKPLVVPKYDPLGKDIKFTNEDGKFDENPAKATGNDQFTPTPGVGDWFETVKLNYGVDIQNNRKAYFDVNGKKPDTWYKSLDILIYWAKMGVDGFRCDMAEMVPVEFWGWAIPQVKKANPNVVFIAEIYNRNAYKDYIEKGKFDYLYDKVGIYDSIKKLIYSKNTDGNANDVYFAWNNVKNYHQHMLTFLENHDEMRLGWKEFCKDPWNAIPGMVYSATIFAGPTMIYFGQEVGEPGDGLEGFSGKDGKTTIFDYWGVPQHQKWVNGGKYDGGMLSPEQKKLRDTYMKILNLAKDNEAINQGNIYDLCYANTKNQSLGFSAKYGYAYIRYSAGQKLLFVYNFDRVNPMDIALKIPVEGWKAMGLEVSAKYMMKDIFMSDMSVTFTASDTTNRYNQNAGVALKLAPYSVYIFEISPAKE
ncbi:MAG: alpha-amylase [Spirochaetes bacterium GWF1_51_8]|nr:MAG: alpha-amylase [Spirochaetes bacterium GWF1_51_8]